MKFILSCLLLTFHIAGQAQYPKWEYPTKWGLVANEYDTTFQIVDGVDKIHRIKSKNQLAEYYSNGNLLGQGTVKKKECYTVVKVNGEEEKHCNYDLNGTWTIYYNTVNPVLRARIIYKDNEEVYSEHFDVSGRLLEKKHYLPDRYIQENFDSLGRLQKWEEYKELSNRNVLLSEVVYDGDQVVKRTGINLIQRWFYLNIGLYWLIIGILMGIKVVLGFYLFPKYYRNREGIDLMPLVSLSSVFFFWMREFDPRYRNYILVFNIVGVTIIFLFLTVWVSFFIP